MKQAITPIVPSWIRDPLARWGSRPWLCACGRLWYNRSAAHVARKISDLVNPTEIYLKGSAAWNDVTPGLSDFDLAVIAAEVSETEMVSQMVSVRRYLASVPRPWIPLGEVSWILEGEQNLFQRVSLRLPARHYYLKKFSADRRGSWGGGGWGKHATAQGLYESALEKYLDGYHQLQFAVQGVCSTELAHLQAAKFWKRCLSFLQASESEQFPKEISTVAGPVSWPLLGEMAAQCLAKLEAATPLIGEIYPSPEMTETNLVRAYAGQLGQLLERELGVKGWLRIEPSAPYYFEVRSTDAGLLAKTMRLNFEDAKQVAVKLQFPLLTPRVAAYYRAKVLPRVINYSALFRNQQSIAPMPVEEWQPFIADVLFRSTETLMYRRPEQLLNWSRAFHRLKQETETLLVGVESKPLLAAIDRRAQLFSRCAERLKDDQLRC